MQATIPNQYQPLLTSRSSLQQIANCLAPLKSKRKSEWIADQLDIHPYQHILEVGYGMGYTLQETARRLKVGFLAGTDASIPMYQQAYRRNKSFIRQQLLQLHLGTTAELPYPSGYFHTLYCSHVPDCGKDPQQEILRLASLLKSGGRLVLVFQPPRNAPEGSIRLAAGRIQQDYREAGLINIRMEARHNDPLAGVALTGFKP